MTANEMLSEMMKDGVDVFVDVDTSWRTSKGPIIKWEVSIETTHTMTVGAGEDAHVSKGRYSYDAEGETLEQAMADAYDHYQKMKVL